jgi:hypothetical protein
VKGFACLGLTGGAISICSGWMLSARMALLAMPGHTSPYAVAA